MMVNFENVEIKTMLRRAINAADQGMKLETLYMELLQNLESHDHRMKHVRSEVVIQNKAAAISVIKEGPGHDRLF